MSVPASPGGPFVDLHAHSTASDGALPAAAVVAAAFAAGLAAVALTDHDTMAGVPEAVAAGEQLGIRVVAGVELSAYDDVAEIHLLGLHINEPSGIESALEGFRRDRRDRAVEIVKRLQTLGVPLSMDAVLAQADGGAIGRPHVARALISAGYARDSRDAFDRYLGAGRPANVPKARLEISEAIALVHAAGGVAVYAHPGADGTVARIGRLTEIGLDGVEVRHPGHGAEDTARLGALAGHFGLVPSGGSDWHGAAHGPRVLGAMKVPFEWLERQVARAMLHRAPAAAI